MLQLSRPTGLVLPTRLRVSTRKLMATKKISLPKYQPFSCSARKQEWSEDSPECSADSSSASRARTFWDDYKKSYSFPSTHLTYWGAYYREPKDVVGRPFRGVGYLKKIKSISKRLCFIQILGAEEETELQFIASDEGLCAAIKRLQINSPVFVQGTWSVKHSRSAKAPENSRETSPASGPLPIPKPKSRHDQAGRDVYEIKIQHIQALNNFPKHMNDDDVHPPEQRYLQIRLEKALRRNLKIRSFISQSLHHQIAHAGFQEVETPILFKSTPEGANEFIVPTRKAGQAYALPQSPQQYKQILMASGIHKYYQFARCFRDEDLRTDRQPEFTQIDIEMAFATGETVMKTIEILLSRLYDQLAKSTRFKILAHAPNLDMIVLEKLGDPFPRMQYQRAMLEHGSDKPDPRIKPLIYSQDNVTGSARSMLTYLEDPKIEFCHFNLNGTPQEVKNFLSKFMSSPEAETFRANREGAPGFAIFDPMKPLQGLQVFGHEGAEALTEFYSQGSSDGRQPLGEGSLVMLQAREDNLDRFSGGSTMLGNLRRAIYKAAVADGLLKQDKKHHYLWITDFPMFTPEDGIDPGQGGSAGFKATHHPFTAPKTADDVELMKDNPLEAVADHYDLVVNGVELGGGSRRIHNAEVQRYVMRDVLKMSEERIADFSHLLGALKAGCPPHAGMALGFDRLIAVICGAESIRDVIAFPKSSKGDDLMVKSPSPITDKVLQRYHLRLDKKT